MRVLVVDDSRSARIAIRDSLEKKGYQVFEAADGRQACEMVNKHSPDLVTMDVQMPQMDGFESCAAIRKSEQGRNLPIVFVTGFDTLADRQRGFDLGATEFISKHMADSWLEVARVTDRLLKRDEQFADFTILTALAGENERMVVNRLLTSHGARIMETENAAKALELAASHTSEIDMVICDFSLPDMEGDRLTRTLRLHMGLRHIPILILCTTEERDRVIDIFSAGTTDFIEKPFVQEVFLARVQSQLQLRRIIKELGSKVAELERLSKLRDEFVAMASHDLKSPLNGILGYSQLLGLSRNLTDEQQAYIENINASVAHMSELINNIVELSRNEIKADFAEHKPMTVKSSLSLVLSSVLQNAVSKGILLELDNRFEGEPMIIGNVNQFSRILYNLLSNAIKFTDKGGRITLEVERGNVDLVITVRDTGIGIPQDLLPSLFDRFTKISRRGTAGEPGTGLGMSITKQLVDLHNGTIEVESSVGKGSAFRLSFPLASLEAMPSF